MRKNNCPIALLDRYLIGQLIPNLIFAIAICTILSELIGISFEQVKFVATEGLPFSVAAQVHYLKLPAFLALSLPLSILMATIITYSKLSARNEIIAMQSYGISLYRLLAPTMAIALTITILMFALSELIVPPANYQAALILEKEWQVDRTQLAKYNKKNIIYQEFTDSKTKPRLKFLFFAERFENSKMENILLLKYHNSHLQEIITARIAQWQESQQLWQFVDGHQNAIDTNGFYARNREFELLDLKLSKNIFDYAQDHRDAREINIWELYQRLNIVKHTKNKKTVHQLEINIQERYALPFSCLVFSLLGAALGITTGRKTKSNSLAISGISIFIYYSTQFIATAMTSSGILPILLGVWLPNLACLFLGIYLLEVDAN